MLPIDKNKTKEIEERIYDIEEDDIDDLPKLNDKEIKAIIRHLNSGESTEQFTVMKIGAYKNDLVQAILHHKYQSLEDVFALLDKLSQCAHDFVKVLRNQCKGLMEELDDIFVHDKKPNFDPVDILQKHIVFVINLKYQGYDQKGDIIFETAQMLVLQMIQIMKNIEHVLQTRGGEEVFTENFQTTFIQYVKTYDQSLSLINQALFELEGEYDAVLCKISKEAFAKLLNERVMPDLGAITKQKPLKFA